MNITHQFAELHVNKRLNITNIVLKPVVSLTREELHAKLLPKYCPQYSESERKPRQPENTHCITAIVVYKGKEQHAMLSWASEPITKDNMVQFYSTVPQGAILFAIKDRASIYKLLNAAMA